MPTPRSRVCRTAGIRSVFAFGFPNTSIQDWWFGPDYAGSVERIDGDEARRVRTQYLSDDQGLITMAPGDARHELLQAGGRALRVGAREGARHQHHGPRRHGPVRLHEGTAHGAPGPRPPVSEHDIHPCLAPAPTRSGLLVRDSGGNVSLAPQIELQMGHGWAPAAKARQAGHPDRARLRRGDDGLRPTSSRRCTRSSRSERGRRHQATWDEDLDGNTPTPDLINVRQVLRWATLDGRQGRRHRRPDRLDHAGQEGRPRHHRRRAP